MHKDGFFQKYDSPTNSDFPKDVIDPNLGPRYRNVVVGVVYNKSALKPNEYPKSLEDLAKPQYKGKIVMPDPTQHTTTTQWLASLYKIMGKEKAEKFMRDLAANKPVWVESLLPSAERVASGEFPIAITYVKYAYIHAQKGAPVDYVRDAKLIGDASYITLASKAPHVNAGKAFIDYFLDDESMKIMAKLGEFVNRKGVLPPLPGADKIRLRRDGRSRAPKTSPRRKRNTPRYFCAKRFTRVHSGNHSQHPSAADLRLEPVAHRRVFEPTGQLGVSHRRRHHRLSQSLSDLLLILRQPDRCAVGRAGKVHFTKLRARLQRSRKPIR